MSEEKRAIYFDLNELNSMSENETGIHTNKDNDITLQ